MERIIIHKNEHEERENPIEDRNRILREKIESVNKEFKDNGTFLHADVILPDVVSIKIEWGDWMHEHNYADYIMRKNGFIKTNEQIIEEDYTDSYSSEHFYTLE